MKAIRLVAVFLIFTSSLCGQGTNDFFYGYNTFADWFLDQNAGETTLPILQIPFGGRYQSMGTAYTGYAADIGFFNSNPAGSTIQDYTRLSVFHNNYIEDANIDGAIYTIRSDNLGLAFSGQILYVDFTEYNSWGQRDSLGTYSETMFGANAAYNFWPGTYFGGLSVGASLKAAYRHVPAVLAIVSGDVSNQDAIGIMLDLGLLTRLNFLKFYNSRDYNLGLGLAVKNIGPPVMDDPLPMEATAGLSYKPIRPVSVSCDFIYPLFFDLSDMAASRWSLAFGTNIDITDFLSVQMGTNFRGGNPRISLGVEMIVMDFVVLTNYTLDLVTQLDRPDRFSVEVSLNFGDEGRLEKRKRVDQLYLDGLEAFALGLQDKAIAIWEEALELDPGNEPVRRSLENAQETKRLQQQMDDLQQIE
jgi:hypothetical protein